MPCWSTGHQFNWLSRSVAQHHMRMTIFKLSPTYVQSTAAVFRDDADFSPRILFLLLPLPFLADQLIVRQEVYI